MRGEKIWKLYENCDKYLDGIIEGSTSFDESYLQGIKDAIDYIMNGTEIENLTDIDE